VRRRGFSCSSQKEDTRIGGSAWVELQKWLERPLKSSRCSDKSSARAIVTTIGLFSGAYLSPLGNYGSSVFSSVAILHIVLPSLVKHDIISYILGIYCQYYQICMGEKSKSTLHKVFETRFHTAVCTTENTAPLLSRIRMARLS
jgi:hypothetical protein